MKEGKQEYDLTSRRQFLICLLTKTKVNSAYNLLKEVQTYS